MAQLKITIIGDANGILSDQVQVQQVETVEQLHPETNAIVLADTNPEVIGQQLRFVRATPAIAFLPVYTLQPFEHSLVDGVWGSRQVLQQCEDMRERREALHDNGQMDEIMALLFYLWLRPEAKVIPERDWKSHMAYRYPLLEAFAGSDELAWLLLGRLRNGQMLTEEKVVDRVPLCPECQSAHLIFRETCVACHSIDIEQTQTIHCFTCGHVGLESQFRKAGEMVCPGCSHALRHIGSDYDRPIENIICHDCGEMFVEPGSEAHCAQCGKITPADHVDTRNFSIWKLSDEGRQVCLRGYSGQLVGVLDALNLIRPEFFEFALGWLLGYSGRYQDSPFALVMMNIGNLDDLIRTQGVGQTLTYLNVFVEHLGEQVRTTDFLMRSSETRLWLALPHTPKAGLQAFLGKMEDWIQKRQEDHHSPLQISFLSYCSEDPERFSDAYMLMNHLVNQVQEEV